MFVIFIFINLLIIPLKYLQLEKSIEKDRQKLEELIHEKEMHISAQNDVKKRSEQSAEEEARFVRIMKNVRS